tara:strand:- start:622 stop:1236 length:615 start_codon:yes stop_codon:yes gene_type:complete
MRKPLIAGNWKMNGNRGLAAEMLQAMESSLDQTSADVVVCPPFSLLQSVGECFENTPVFLGAQNVHAQLSGAYTGEISAPMLNEMDVKWCIVGHSERRAQFSETDAIVRQKVGILLQNGIQPIMCVGESLEEREAGKHEEVVVEQLKNGLSGLAADDQFAAQSPMSLSGRSGPGRQQPQNRRIQCTSSSVTNLLSWRMNSSPPR